MVSVSSCVFDLNDERIDHFVKRILQKFRISGELNIELKKKERKETKRISEMKSKEIERIVLEMFCINSIGS